MNSDNFSDNPHSVTISYELLQLLQWLAEHDEPRLKKMINRALASGLANELRRIDDQNSMDIAQNGIINFLSILESLLLEGINEQIAQKAKLQKLLPAIDKIDTSLCDDTVVQFSIQKTTSKAADNPNQNAHDILYEELLRYWEPHNKIKIN